MGHQAPDVELPAVLPVGAPPRRPAARSLLTLRNWRVTWRLIALIAIPTMMGLTFGALRVAAANDSATQFSQIRQLAVLGQQVTGLEQALEDERDRTAGYVAAGRPVPGLAQVKQQYTVTDGWTAQVRKLSAGIGAGYPPQVQAKVNVVLARLSDLAGLRVTAQGGDSDALPLIDEYSSTLDALFSFNDEIAQGSADSALADTVRTLGSLSRMKEDASLQRGILYASLVERQFELGSPSQLTAALAQQAADLSQFGTSATLAQQRLFNNTVPAPAIDHDQVLEQLAVDTGSPQQVGVTPGQWYSSMTASINRMRSVEGQLAASVVSQSQALQQGAEGAAVLTGILSLVLLVIAGVGTFVIARSMVNPLRTLRSDALEIASVRLPEKVRELSDAEDPGADVDVAPVSVHSADEIGQVARAFDQVHREAVRLAGNEALLRNNMNAIFVSLSRRSQSLLERLVRLIDSLEQSEDDPGRLSNLFAMDHLVTRMRRHSENLLVLAGHEPARRWAEPVALTDVVRAAVSEILEYNRVATNVQPGVAVLGHAVNDIVHLLAEIIENATLFSADDSQVKVTGNILGSGGILVEVTDRGIGIRAERMTQLNWRLDNPPVADVSVSRHMGLFAVSHLAARHGVRVRLRQASPQGLTALVWIPETLITTENGHPGWAGAHAERPPKSAAGTGGWSAFGRHRSIRKAIVSGVSEAEQETAAVAPVAAVPPPPAVPPSPAVPPPPAVPAGAGTSGPERQAPLAEPVPIYDSMASQWFRHGARVPVQGPRASWDSPADAGWRAAESAAAPVRGQLTAAGLPQRIPRANMVPGSVREGQAPGRATGLPARPAPADAGLAGPVPPRSADKARARLAGFQRGTRRAESTASPRGGRPPDG